MNYVVCLNNGNENFAFNEKTITANEIVETADERALAREIAHENPLIPEQVATSVLENFCKAAAHLMAMGFAIQMKCDGAVALRIYPDIHVKDTNINLARAKELDPTVTELTLQNAGDLVSKAGLTVRAKAECRQKFTDLLLADGASLQRKEVIERAKIVTSGGLEPTEPALPGEPNEGGNTGGNGGNQGGGTGIGE